MRKRVFGQVITAIDVEHLPPDTGPTAFVRLCGALIGKALADRVGSFTLPQISERINVPDGGVDAEYTTPDALSVPETGGLIGPGRTVFQFKYRGATSASKPEIIRNVIRQLRKEFPRVAPQCDRYVFMTNIQLSGAQLRRIRDALVESSPALAHKQIVIWAASEVAQALNLTPHLRHLLFAEGGLCTLDFTEEELKASYRKTGWPSFIGREDECHAIAAFVRDKTARVLYLAGPRYVGKTRLAIEALRPFGSSVLWAASPDDASLDLFRDLDSSETDVVLVVDRCDTGSAHELGEWAHARQRLKTIFIRTESDFRHLTGEKETLPVQPLGNQEAYKLLSSAFPGTPFMHQSWLVETAGGLPGFILHVGALIKEARLSTSLSPGEIENELGRLVEEQYVSELTPEARQALEVASLLSVLGLEGDVGKEIDAVCTAFDVPAGVLKTYLRTLEHSGLVRHRGRFVEVVPPLLADYLASRALTYPDRSLPELLIALEAGALLRFLDRFRNLRNPAVRNAIAKLFSVGGWFDDLNALITSAKKLEILTPAAPTAALQCIERLLGGMSAEELKTRLVEDARRALVWALEDLALRSETFEGSARQLLRLAEAENEKWANNAQGVFLSLFHWRHPEVTVSLSRRLGVLQEGAKSESASRRKILATACGEAFTEYASFRHHHPKGPTLPEEPYRAATWTEVGEYAAGVLCLLSDLSGDISPEVAQAAVSSLLAAFRPFVQASLRLPEAKNEVPELGRATFDLLARIGRTTHSARVRTEVVSHLELVIETLSEAASKDSPTVQRAIELAKDLHAALTDATFQDKLWRWVGTPSWELRRSPDHADVPKAIEAIAAQFLRNPDLLLKHLDWLTSEDARQGPWLFQTLGEKDRGTELFKLLLAHHTQPSWPRAFSAYIAGWSRYDRKGSEAALDNLAATRPELLEGVLQATCAVQPSDKTVARLLRLVSKDRLPRSEIVGQIALFAQWSHFGPEDAETLIRALDDGSPRIRSLFLSAFVTRILKGGEMTVSLQELAWSFLQLTFPVDAGHRGHEWDRLAAELGEQDPQRLLRLLEKLAIRDLTAGPKRYHWEHELPLVWETLEKADRCGLLRFLLRLVMNPDVPYSIDWRLSHMLDPSRDRDVLLQFVRETGIEGARVLALNLEAHKPGFWELARDLIAEWGHDDLLTDRLHSSVMSGGWSGSAVPMIKERIENAKRLISDSDSRVQTWAQEVLSSLEARRRHEEREDAEEWIWDYRIRRSEFEGMLKQKDSPERLWAIGRLLKDAPPKRVLELLTLGEILDALPKIQDLDDRTRRTWEGYARLWSQAH